MGDTEPGRKNVHVPRRDDVARAAAVLVTQSARHGDRYDLHVLVRMQWNSLARRQPFLVEHAQTSEARALRIVVSGEAEGAQTDEAIMTGPAPGIRGVVNPAHRRSLPRRLPRREWLLPADTCRERQRDKCRKPAAAG